MERSGGFHWGRIILARRGVLAIVVAALIWMGSPLCWAADQTGSQARAERPLRDQIAIPVDLAPVYGFPSEANAPAPQDLRDGFVPLGPLNTNAVGTEIGVTTYDYQHNCTMGRQVEHRGTNYVHFDWMRQTYMILGGDRRIGYEAYNLQTCSFVFGSGGIVVDSNYSGYVSLDVNSTNCPIPAGHEANYPQAYWNSCPSNIPSSTFSSDYPTDRFGWYLNSGTGPTNYNLWPKIDWQVGTEAVLHLVAAESGGTAGQPQTISYYRRVGPYGAGLGVWSAQRVIDTVKSVSPTVVSSPTTDKVALVWVAPANYKRDTPNEYNSQYENDVWYTISNNQGASWMSGSGSIAHLVVIESFPGGNITTYANTDAYKAYCDLSALITSDNNLHIVWGCRKWADSTTVLRRQSAIFHWSEDHPVVRVVVKAEWDTGGTCYAHAWGSDAAKMSISQCDGRLYVLYTQFGSATAPCADYNAGKNVMNGELYLTASDDGGANWDRPRNLTNSPSPFCQDGSCESDYWASMARYGRTEVCGLLTGQKVLDVIYINDKSAGSVIQSESGIWTTNPVMWLRTTCRLIPGHVSSLANSGPGSLREAIDSANARSGIDTIAFTVSGTITLLSSPLPALIDDSTVILGATAPGGAHSIILDGSALSGGDGFVIQSRDNLIEGLVIKNFPGNGITVSGASSIRNRLTNNLIFNNNGLGIDLGANGVTANDVGDGDSGPNNLLNFPVIDSAVSRPNGSYDLYGTAPFSARVEFFIAHPIGQPSRPADPSGHGEAYTYLGYADATYDGNFQYNAVAGVGHFSVITTTATDVSGNTSEFSANTRLVPQPLIVVAYSPVNIIVTDPDGLRFGRDELNVPITEISPAAYFVTPNDSVVIYQPKLGTYIINFVTEVNAPIGATYSAIIQIDGTQQLTLAADKQCYTSGTMDSYSYNVEEGYHYKNGDGNRGNTINIGDAVFVINYIFKGGMAPDPYLAADANCDKTVNVGDAVNIVNYIFKGGPAPCAF